MYGYAVITKSSAALWTTEKFYALADQQLDCNWELMKLGEPGVIIIIFLSRNRFFFFRYDKMDRFYFCFVQVPSLTEWLKKVLKRGLYRVGADPRMIPSSTWEEWNRELGESDENI